MMELSYKNRSRLKYGIATMSAILAIIALIILVPMIPGVESLLTDTIKPGVTDAWHWFKDLNIAPQLAIAGVATASLGIPAGYGIYKVGSSLGEDNLDKKKQNTQKIAILRSVSSADPENRRFGNALRIQLGNEAKKQGKNVETTLIDFDEIFRNAIDKAYKLKTNNNYDSLSILKSRLNQIITESLNRHPDLKKAFLAHYNEGRNDSNYSDYNEGKNTLNYLNMIYRKEIIPALSQLQTTMEQFAKKSDGVTKFKESQYVDYKNPNKVKMLLVQEEKAILGSMLMGKWATPELCGEIYDQEKYHRIKDFIRGSVRENLKDVDHVYTHGYSYNPANPGRPINASRSVVENTVLSICMKEENTPILAVCGGMQNFWLKQGAKLQRIGSTHSGDIHHEDKIYYLPEENIIYDDNYWSTKGKKASDAVLKHIKDTGFTVKDRSVKVNCDHSQAVLYTPELKDKIFKLDPKAIVIISNVDSNPATDKQPDIQSVKKSNIKKQNRGLDTEPAVIGQTSIIEAVIMPTRGIITMQSHPDGFKHITTTNGIKITDDQILDAGINSDGEEMAHRASVKSNSNKDVLAKIIAKGKRSHPELTQEQYSTPSF